MSRVISRTSAVRQTQPTVSTGHKYTKQLCKIIGLLLHTKQKQHLSTFFTKCRQLCKLKKQRSTIMIHLLHNLQIRKSKQNYTHAVRKLINNKNSSIKKQQQDHQKYINNIRSRAAKILAYRISHIFHSKISHNFNQLKKGSKIVNNLRNFRNRSIIRIFNSLYTSKLKIGFDRLRVDNLKNLKIKSNLNRMLRWFEQKRLNYLTLSLGLISCVPKKQSQTTKPSKTVNDNKNSRVKTASVTQSPKQDEQLNKAKEIEEKNKIEQESKKLKKQHEKQMEQYRKQISNLEAEHESLKFNSGILDEAIQDLQSQIVQKQKKSKKVMLISELWDRVYSNFLLLLSQHKGQTIPKEKVLQSLEVPLVSLNVDTEQIKAQNQILTDLLTEYRKFFQSKTPEDNAKQQIVLPYDILITKNRFLYAAVETLIRHGLGTEAQVKQLQAQLDSMMRNN